MTKHDVMAVVHKPQLPAKFPHGLTHQRLASTKAPHFGPWRRHCVLFKLSRRSWWTISGLMGVLPPECVTKKKMRSPRSDMTMEEITLAVDGLVLSSFSPSQKYVDMLKSQHDLVMWVLTAPRSEIMSTLVINKLGKLHG